MLKSIRALVVSAIAAFMATAALAETKIAVMDYQAVLFNSVAAQDASVVLRASLADVQARLQELQQGLESRQQRLETDKDILTEEEIAQYRAEMDAMVQEQQQLAAQIQQAQQQSRVQFNEQFKPLIRELVTAFVAKTDYNLIVEAQAVLWNVDTPDITEEILNQFDNEYAKLKAQSDQ